MAGNIIPFGNQLPERAERRLGRALNTIEHNRRFDLARIEAQAEVEAAKVDGVTFVGQVAMQNVAMLSQLEAQLSQVVPMATSRLQAIADITALGVAEVVTHTARKLR